MKKVLTSLALALAITGTATAQNAYESSVKFDKSNQNAVVANFENPAEVVEAALKERLAKEGMTKMKSVKGFKAYLGTVWPSVSQDKVDVYFKVDGKKENSTVSIMVSKGYNNFMTSGTDPDAINAVKSFLNSLASYTNSYQLAQDIKAQEEMLKKAQKAHAGAIDNNKDLLSEKEKIEKKIAESNNDQTLKQNTLDQEQKKLDALKARLVN